MNEKWLKWVAVVAGIGLVAVLVFASTNNQKSSIDSEEIGRRVVRLLYSFRSIQELDANVNELG